MRWRKVIPFVRRTPAIDDYTLPELLVRIAIVALPAGFLAHLLAKMLP